MQPNSELRDYVIMARRTGHSDVEIRQVLLNAGWNPMMVQDVFTALQTPPAPTPAPGSAMQPIANQVQMPITQVPGSAFMNATTSAPAGQPTFMQKPLKQPATSREMPAFVGTLTSFLKKLVNVKVFAGLAVIGFLFILVSTSAFGLLKKTSIEVDGFYVDLHERWQLESGTEAVTGLLYKDKSSKVTGAAKAAQLGVFTTAGSVSRADLTLKAFESEGTLDVLFDDTGSTGETNSTYRILEFLYNDKISQQVTRVKILEIVTANTVTVEYRIPDGLWEEYSTEIESSIQKTIAKN